MSKADDVWEDIREGLEGMLACINQIEPYLEELKNMGHYDDYKKYKEFKHPGIYDDILRFLGYMCCEADENIPNEFKKQHPELPWLEMNTFLEHSNYEVDIIWHIVNNELPQNKAIIQKLLNTYG
ncbi:hypothetical protein BKI52_00355 [marine bacterium AO1-C]|nr:hypothetical protein BKI52_00355 [marine bacterium AO1-C]